jgi:hypothetical protein
VGFTRDRQRGRAASSVEIAATGGDLTLSTRGSVKRCAAPGLYPDMQTGASMVGR